MGENKHTPGFDPKGPYTLRERYTVRSPRVERIDLMDAVDRVVASVLADDTEELENCTILEVVSKRGKANARFLGAAPEMLEALQDLAHPERRTDCNERKCGSCSTCRARTVIAKATGKAP